MKIEKITYQKVFPIGPFSNERIGLEVIVEPGDDPSEIAETLRKMVHSMSIPAGVPKCIGEDGLERVDFDAIPEAVRECKDIVTLSRLKPYLPARFEQLYRNKMQYFLKDREPAYDED
jgi:hypothetical protein